MTHVGRGICSTPPHPCVIIIHTAAHAHVYLRRGALLVCRTCSHVGVQVQGSDVQRMGSFFFVFVFSRGWRLDAIVHDGPELAIHQAPAAPASHVPRKLVAVASGTVGPKRSACVPACDDEH